MAHPFGEPVALALEALASRLRSGELDPSAFRFEDDVDDGTIRLRMTLLPGLDSIAPVQAPPSAVRGPTPAVPMVGGPCPDACGGKLVDAGRDAFGGDELLCLGCNKTWRPDAPPKEG